MFGQYQLPTLTVSPQSTPFVLPNATPFRFPTVAPMNLAQANQMPPTVTPTPAPVNTFSPVGGSMNTWYSTMGRNGPSVAPQASTNAQAPRAQAPQAATRDPWMFWRSLVAKASGGNPQAWQVFNEVYVPQFRPDKYGMAQASIKFRDDGVFGRVGNAFHIFTGNAAQDENIWKDIMSAIGNQAVSQMDLGTLRFQLERYSPLRGHNEAINAVLNEAARLKSEGSPDPTKFPEWPGMNGPVQQSNEPAPTFTPPSAPAPTRAPAPTPAPQTFAPMTNEQKQVLALGF